MEPKVFLCIQTDAKADSPAPYFLIEQIETMNGTRFRVAGRYKLLRTMEQAAKYPDKYSAEDPNLANS